MVIARAPERIETERLALRRPRPDDAPAIFERYSSDPDVTRLMGWARHESVAATREFLEFADAEWSRWPAGPYLIESRPGGRLLGGTGLAFATPARASTGYVLARDAWGQGYATEALRAVVDAAARCGVVRLDAVCHIENPRSRRVLEKCGFVLEGILRRHTEFPNLASDLAQDVYSYARIFEPAGPGSR